MASLIETRRNILMSAPHLTTASGQLATFQTDLAAPIKDMKVHFSPVQASGTPSPDNVLPISGWDGVTVYNGQTVVASITFPQTIYGGYVDLVKGEVVEEYQKVVLDGVNRWLTAGVGVSDSRGGRFVNYVEAYNYFNNGGLQGYGSPPRFVSDWDWKSNRFASNNTPVEDYGELSLVGNNTYIRLYICKSQLEDISDKAHILASMKAWLADNPVEISYKLATPNVYPLTPQTIKTLKGINNIFSDAIGNVDVTYWTH